MSDIPARVALHGQCHTVSYWRSKDAYLVTKLGSRFNRDRRFMTKEEVLALEPWDAFKARREAKADKAPRGNCQICGRSIGIKAGVIAHHGYERPGHGWQTSSCFGARRLPYEKDRGAIAEYIEILKSDVPRLTAVVDRLESPDFNENLIVSRKHYRSVVTDTLEPGSRKWEAARQAQITNTKQRLAAIPEEIAYFEKRYADWPGVQE